MKQDSFTFLSKHVLIYVNLQKQECKPGLIYNLQKKCFSTFILKYMQVILRPEHKVFAKDYMEKTIITVGW